MINGWKRTWLAVRVACLVGFSLLLGYFALRIIIAFWIERPTKVVETTAASFMGAFFAFAFVKLGEALGKLYKRKVDHLNGLIRLQYMSNEHVSMLADIMTTIDETRAALLNNSDGSGRTFILAKHTALLPVDKDGWRDLVNISLLNEVFDYNIDVQRANNDLARLERAIESTYKLYTDGRTGRDNFEAETKRLADKLPELLLLLKDLQNDAKRLFAAARLLSDDQPALSFIITHILKERYGRDFETLRTREMAMLEKEIAEMHTRSVEHRKNLLQQPGK